LKTGIFIACCLVLLQSCETINDTNPATGLNDVPFLDAWIPHDEYASLLSNRWGDEEAPIEIFMGRNRYTGIVEAQGSGSRYHARWSYKLVLDGSDFLNNLASSNLSAQVLDRSMLRTTLASHVFSSLGFPSFEHFHVFLSINGRNKGLYVQIERVDEDFLSRRGMPVHELIKIGFGTRFSYRGDMHLERFFTSVIPKNGNLNNMGDLVRTLDTTKAEAIFQEVGRYLDVREYLRYHAAASILNHIDGFSNNLLFWKATPDQPYSIIPWDFDKVLFDGEEVGLYGDNDIIHSLFRNDSCKALYSRKARAMLDTLITPERLFPLLDAESRRIGSAWALDPALGLSGFSLERETERLKQLIGARRAYFLEQLGTLGEL